MSIPQGTRKRIREQLWAEADSLGWIQLSGPDKSRQYDDWVVREDIGGALSRHMDARQVRVYLKDSVMKPYAHHHMESPERPFRVLGLDSAIAVAEEYTKPHGRRLADNRVVCWGPASNWKAVIMAAFERSHLATANAHAVVLFRAQGRYRSDSLRALIEEASARLGIERVVWLED